MAKSYSVKWVIDDSQAKAALSRTLAGYAKAERAALATATAIEKSAVRASVAWDTSAQVAARSAASLGATQVKAAQASAAGIGAAAVKASKAQVKASAAGTAQIAVSLASLQASGLKMQDSLAAASAKASAQKAKAAAQTSALEDQLLKRDYDSRVRYEAGKVKAAERASARLITAKERDAAKLQAIEARYLAKEYKARVAHQKKLEADAAGAAERQEAMTLKVAGAVTAGAAAGLAFLNEGYKRIRDDAEAAAKATLELRKTLLIEATLKGAGQTGDKQLKESLVFRAKTGLGEREASEFTREFRGSLPIGLEKGNITQETADKLEVQAGIMAARQGGDKGTKGELAGILGQFGKVDSVEAGLGQLESIREGLTAGRGDDPDLTKQLLKSAGSIVKEGGKVGDIREMAALIGVTSLSGGTEQAGTRAEQLNRVFSAGITREGKPKGAVESQKAYLTGLGVTEKSSLEESLDKVVPDMMKAKAGGRDLNAYLREHGMGSEEERRALIETSENFGPLKERFAASRKAGQGAKVLEQNREYLASPLGMEAMGQAAQSIATVTKGVPGERTHALKTLAEGSPEVTAGDQHFGQSLVDTFMGAITGNITGGFEGMRKAGRETRVEGVAVRAAEEQAAKLGIGKEELTKARHDSYGTNVDPTAGYINKVEALINAKGGKLEADLGPALEKLTRTMDDMNNLLRGNGAAKAPPAMARP